MFALHKRGVQCITTFIKYMALLRFITLQSDQCIIDCCRKPYMMIKKKVHLATCNMWSTSERTKKVGKAPPRKISKKCREHSTDCS